MSGITSYYEFNDKMTTSHKRVLSGIGEEAFRQSVTSRFPLTLTDEAVMAIASDLGWQSGWLMAKPKAKATPPVQMQNLAAFMVKAGPPASQVAVGAPTNVPLPVPAAGVAPPPPAPVHRNMIVRSPAVAWSITLCKQLTTVDNS